LVRLTNVRAAILPTFLVVSLAALLAGCGSGSSHTPTNAELVLERAGLVQVSHELRTLETPVRHEVSASRVAWPTISNGLPSALSGSLRSAVANASTAARALPEPQFVAHPGGLTGPAAGMAGLYESYSRLASKGWRLTETGIAAILRGAPAAASFARGNSSLYIAAVYDGHFDLSLLGKSLVSGYEKLGGAAAFGAGLPPGEVTALAAVYSIPAVRLEPHPGRDVSEA
jgi:hypothetical protein